MRTRRAQARDRSSPLRALLGFVLFLVHSRLCFTCLARRGVASVTSDDSDAYDLVPSNALPRGCGTSHLLASPKVRNGLLTRFLVMQRPIQALLSRGSKLRSAAERE